MRWKAHFFLQGNNTTKRVQTYGLKSKQVPPPVQEWKQFEEDVIQLTENIQFRNVNGEFMKTLQDDKKRINSSNNVFIAADKTRNMYEMIATAYNKLLTENVTKTYKLTQQDTIKDINTELKHIADDYGMP